MLRAGIIGALLTAAFARGFDGERGRKSQRI